MDKNNGNDGARNGRQQEATAAKKPQAGDLGKTPSVQQGGETVVQFRDWASI